VTDKLNQGSRSGPESQQESEAWKDAQPRATYSAVRLSSGKLLPIEVRLGRRVLRYIPAESAEGKRLIAEERVEIINAGSAAD
jgi:hypothetical protein